jgi:hypothetical protein
MLTFAESSDVVSRLMTVLKVRGALSRWPKAARMPRATMRTEKTGDIGLLLGVETVGLQGQKTVDGPRIDPMAPPGKAAFPPRQSPAGPGLSAARRRR